MDTSDYLGENKSRSLWLASIGFVVLFLLSFGLSLSQALTRGHLLGYVTALLSVFLAALNLFVFFRARKSPVPSWLPWIVIFSLWTFTNAIALLYSGMGLALGLLHITLTLFLGLQLFNPRQVLPVVLLSAFTALPIFLIEFVLQLPFRTPLLPRIAQTLPIQLGIVLIVLVALLYQQFNRFSLRWKLIISFLFVSLLPVLIIGLLNDISFRQALTNSANQSLFSVASQTALTIDRAINAQKETVLIESQLPSFREFLSLPPDSTEYARRRTEAEALLNDLHDFHLQEQGENVYLYGYMLLDSDGNILFDTTSRSEPSDTLMFDSFSQNPIFLNTALTGLPGASPVLVFENPETASIFFSSRVVNDIDQPVGGLITRFDAGFLQDILADANDLAGPGSFGVLFDENLVHLAHGIDPGTFLKTTGPLGTERFRFLQRTNRLPNLPPEEIFLDLPDLQEKLRNSARQPFFTAEDVATGELLNQVAVIQLESYPWRVAFFQPRNIFLTPVRAQTTNSLLVIAAVGIGAVLVAFFASTQLARPILRLRDAAMQVAEGNLDVTAEVETEDEIGALATTFNNMTAQLNQTLTGLEDLVAERTARLRATNEVGRVATSILNPDDLIARIVKLISERFGFYYAAIFLSDENNQWAVLKDATGDAGKILKERNHRLEIGGNSMVGAAISSRQARIAQNVGDEKVRFDNPVLPRTRSEIALPLMVGDRVLGALDVQSRRESAFSDEDLRTLQNVANQVAIAIENANLFDRSQRAFKTQETINRISTRIQRAADVETILEATLTELSRALDSDEASILLTTEEGTTGPNGRP